MFPAIPTEMKEMRNTLADIRTFVSIKVTSELQKVLTSVEGLKKGMNYSLYLMYNCAKWVRQDDQRMKMLNWLSPLQPQKRHQDVRSMRLNNTGGWLLNDQRFTAWCTGQGLEPEDRILCCYGMPGAGKTVMWWALTSRSYLAETNYNTIHQFGSNRLPLRIQMTLDTAYRPDGEEYAYNQYILISRENE